MTVTDAHIHIQPFHMMPAPVAATFWKGKPNRAELEGYAADPRKLLARMDEDEVDRVPGARSRLGDPMDVDDVAVDFPRLTILLAHGGRPLWMETAFFLVRRHPNVHLESSGIPPSKLLDYFPRIEEIAAKTVWGTDWPSPGMQSRRTNVDAFLAWPVSDAAKRQILHGNAAKIWRT